MGGGGGGAWRKAHVRRGFARISPSSRTIPTPTLLAEPSMPSTSMMTGNQAQAITLPSASHLLAFLLAVLPKPWITHRARRSLLVIEGPASANFGNNTRAGALIVTNICSTESISAVLNYITGDHLFQQHRQHLRVVSRKHVCVAFPV